MDNGVSDSPGLVTCLTKGFFKALTPGCSIFSIRSGPETVGVETAEGRAGVPSEKKNNLMIHKYGNHLQRVQSFGKDLEKVSIMMK